MRIVILLMFSMFALSLGATNPVTVSTVDNALVAEKTIAKKDALNKTGFIKQLFSKVKKTYNKVAKFVKTEILDNLSDRQLLVYALVLVGIAIVLGIFLSFLPFSYGLWTLFRVLIALISLAGAVLFVLWLLRVL